jgi:hypothetical protein
MRLAASFAALGDPTGSGKVIAALAYPVCSKFSHYQYPHKVRAIASLF